MKPWPQELKFKKNHKVNYFYFKAFDNRTSNLIYGQYGLKALNSGKLAFKQIEAARKSIRRNLSINGVYWIRVFSYHSVTKKPGATRMGSGKGGHFNWICPIWRGQILFELSGVSLIFAKRILKKAGSKLSVKNKFVVNFF